MSQAKGKAAATRAAAAQAETNGKPKEITYRGLKLELPPQLGSEVAYAYAELEGASGVKPTVDFIKSLIGEEQATRVRAKHASDGVTFDELAEEFNKLLALVFAAYGTNKGESSASLRS